MTTTLFESIQELANIVQSIKRKYPIVVAYAKHLQKLEDDTSREKEIDHFKEWMLNNPRIIDERQFDDSYYVSSKHSIVVCFASVLELASPDVIEKFWKQLNDIEKLLFPSGRPETRKIMMMSRSRTVDGETMEVLNEEDDTAAALAVIEKDPLLSGIVQGVRSVTENMTNPNDIGSIVESPVFDDLVSKIGTIIANGSRKPKDLTRTLRNVMATIKKENLTPDMKEFFDTVTSVINSIERGQTPDVSKLMSIIGMKSFL